jgi:hypothetical protein
MIRCSKPGSDHFVSAKLRRNVFKERIALGRRYRFGGLYQAIEIVIWELQPQLVQGRHGRESFPAGEPHYEAGALPQLYGSTVDITLRLCDRLLIVIAFNYGRRCGDVTVSCGDVDAIVGHGGLCRGNVNGYHMPQMLSVRYPTDINPELQFPESRCARERPRDHFNRGLLRPCWGQGGMSYPEQDALSQSPSGWEGSRRPHLNSADAGEGAMGGRWGQ